MPDQQQAVIGGIDCHTDFHVAVALDPLGRILGTEAFPATSAGYRSTRRWLASFGPVAAVGVESTGSYGAALTRFLAGQGCGVIETCQPHAHLRARRGKNDAIDAEAAARKVLSGEATSAAKDTSGIVESIRQLSVARSSAVKARSAALRSVGRRIAQLGAEADDLEHRLDRLVATAAPTTLQRLGCGTHHTAALLVAAGENIDRLSSEASFAHLCGTAPIPASSGRTSRHRLNYAGNRAANRTLHMIVIARLRYCERTRSYVERRVSVVHPGFCAG
ncbi:MAG: transposase [Acidimicrobiaceae bacterium]|nr:transposase [Acidimicrobiaceae bacterium]